MLNLITAVVRRATMEWHIARQERGLRKIEKWAQRQEAHDNGAFHVYVRTGIYRS